MSTDDRLPYTVLIPAGTGVTEVIEQSAALRMAIVDREAVGALDDSWDNPGVYLLLDRHSPEGTWGAYVGMAPTGIRGRVKNHVSHKDHWYRAILVKRDTSLPFNSAHTGWLEGRLYDMLDAAPGTVLHNKQRPGDDTLASYDLLMLEAAIDPIARLLRLLGHDPAPADEATAQVKTRKSSVYFGVSVSDVIAAGLLSPPTRIVSTMTGYPADATIEGDGTVTWEGHSYPSLSAAAAAARDGAATNGWDYWAVDTATGKVRMSTLRARYQSGIKSGSRSAT